MIEYACTHCGEPLASPDSMIGRFEHCPACQRRVKVIDPAVVRERNRCTDRQLAFASSLGLKANIWMTKQDMSYLLTCYDRVKHYIYGLIIYLTGRTAADLEIPRQAVESFAASLVNQNDSLVDRIFDQVGPDQSSSEFIRPRTDLYRQMASLLVLEFGSMLGN